MRIAEALEKATCGLIRLGLQARRDKDNLYYCPLDRQTDMGRRLDGTGMGPKLTRRQSVVLAALTSRKQCQSRRAQERANSCERQRIEESA